MKPPKDLIQIKSITELKVGLTVWVGYSGMKKSKFEIVRFKGQKDRKDYKRYWETRIGEGIVYKEKPTL